MALQRLGIFSASRSSLFQEDADGPSTLKHILFSW